MSGHSLEDESLRVTTGNIDQARCLLSRSDPGPRNPDPGRGWTEPLGVVVLAAGRSGRRGRVSASRGKGAAMKLIGAVRYLNARPLIDGLEARGDLRVLEEVPSRLASALCGGDTDIALCPVIDYQRAPRELVVVPVGCIASRGATLTVRVFSRLPFEEVETVWVDTDSHSSIALLQVVFQSRFGRVPSLQPLPKETPVGGLADTCLLIGDKVVVREPERHVYPFQMDLGKEWRDQTGLPFVFAVWMARSGATLGSVPATLDEQRRRNCRRLSEIVDAHAQERGWPPAIALDYLGSLLEYEVTATHLDAMRLFWRRCLELGVIERLRPLKLYHDGDQAVAV
jgi:chorismate dehydratase